MEVEMCAHGHVIRSSADRLNGYCRMCKAATDKQYQLKRKAALEVCRGLEKYGVRFENAGVPVTPEDVAKQLLEVYGPQIS